jgi:hypothetical protein
MPDFNLTTVRFTSQMGLGVCKNFYKKYLKWRMRASMDSRYPLNIIFLIYLTIMMNINDELLFNAYFFHYNIWWSFVLGSLIGCIMLPIQMLIFVFSFSHQQVQEENNNTFRYKLSKNIRKAGIRNPHKLCVKRIIINV